MYSSFQLAKKYIDHYISSSNGRGHGIHSPFVFDLVKQVLNDKKENPCFDRIEALRSQLLNNKQLIEVQDHGAGSAVIRSHSRRIDKIAASSLKEKKYGQLLYRLVKYYKPRTIIELGTSFGISTSYMAFGNEAATVYTLEGASSIATIARNNFHSLGIKNVRLIEGDFGTTFPGVLSTISMLDMAFVDGNHRKAPTVEYFRQLLRVANNTTMLIFDDIHWSAEMEEAWREIMDDAAVTLTVDLFFMGLVFINPDFKVKQHFKIRF